MEDKNKISTNGVNWLLFFNIVLYVVITEIVIFVNSYFSFDEPDAHTTRIVVQLFAILLPVVIFTKTRKVNIKSFFRINALGYKNILLCAGIGICSQFIGLILKLVIRLVFEIFKIPYVSGVQQSSVPETASEVLVAVIALTILPVFAEEFLFRGLVLRSYEKWGTMSALVISSLLFGLLHLDVSSIFATVYMGIILAYVVIKTDSLLAGIILHFVNNGTALILALYPVSTVVLSIVFPLSLILFFVFLSIFRKINIQSKNIPQKRSVSTEIVRTVFNLPILLCIAAFVIIQLYIFRIL